MSCKHFSKLFLFQYKYRSRLFKFPNCVFNAQFCISSHSEPAARVETQLNEFSNEKSRIRTFGKTKFLKNEHLGALLYLSKNHEKYDIVKYEDVDLAEETNFKSLVLLKDFVQKICPEEPETNVISEELMNSIESECNSYSLTDIYKYIILTSKLRSGESRLTLLKYLNIELIRRKSELTKTEHLKILYLCLVLLRENYLGKDFPYTKKKLYYLTEKIESLTPKQLVVFFSIARWLSKEVLHDYKFRIITSLLQNMANFNIDEMIIISRGFYAACMEIEKPLSVAFANKFVEEVGNPHELQIYVIFKVIGSGAYLLNYDGVATFQEKMLPHAGKYEGKDLIHLVRTGEQIAYVNLSLWDILVNNFKKNIKRYSLADIEKMIYMTVICNIQDEELLKMSIEEFQNADMSSISHHAFICFVYDLIHHQIYDEKLLSLVLSEDFRKDSKLETYSPIIKQKYCFINSFIKFHRPESNFDFLDDVKQDKLYKMFKVYSKDFGILNCFTKLRRIMFSLVDIYGRNYVCFTSFQPHFNRGIVMRFDKNSEAQPIPEEFMSSTEHYKRALNDDHIWLFIIVVSHYHFKQDTDVPNFEFQTQLRELEAFGYIPVLIHSNDAESLKKNRQDSRDSLKDLLRNKVQEVKNKQRVAI